MFKDGFGFVYNPNDCAPSQAVNVSDSQITFIPGQCSPPLPARDATDAELMQHTRETTMAKASETGETGEEQYTAYGPGADLIPPAEGDLFGYRGPADRVSEFGEMANRDRDDSRGRKSRPGPDFSEEHPEKLKGEKDEESKDTNSPKITIISGPSVITNLSKAIFSIKSDEHVTLRYEMGDWSASSKDTESDTLTIDGLSEGSHTLTVIATDSAGNETRVSYTWTTDYSAPVPSLTSPPAPIGSSSSASFDITAGNRLHTTTHWMESL